VSTTTSQQFEGTTIEEALEAAVASLGDELEIIDAQRVRRRGVLGMGRRDVFEVTAARKAEQADAFDDVLKRMVSRVDQAEQRLGVDLADTDLTWWTEADFVLPANQDMAQRLAEAAHVADTGEEIIDVRQAEATDPKGQIDVASLVEAVEAAKRAQIDPDLEPSATATPKIDPEPRRRVAPAHAANPINDAGDDFDDFDELSSVEWSTEGLLAVGLPPALVGRLPDDLESDLEWVAALAKAIDELLETAAEISGPCELTGYGQHAAVHLIRGACNGFRVGALVVDGERIPATPMELALALRSTLRDPR
jgi:hypothetical protein